MADLASPSPGHQEELKVKKEIYLYPSSWATIEALGRLLRHEDLDETLSLLTDVATKMVDLTTPEDRKVKLFGHPDPNQPRKTCKECGRSGMVYTREAMILLGRESR
jgi:predicted nucleic acid-binding OB-fold protein